MARVRLSSEFDLSGSKQFEVCYVWVRPNTKLNQLPKIEFLVHQNLSRIDVKAN